MFHPFKKLMNQSPVWLRQATQHEKLLSLPKLFLVYSMISQALVKKTELQLHHKHVDFFGMLHTIIKTSTINNHSMITTTLVGISLALCKVCTTYWERPISHFSGQREPGPIASDL